MIRVHFEGIQTLERDSLKNCDNCWIKGDLKKETDSDDYHGPFFDYKWEEK